MRLTAVLLASCFGIGTAVRADDAANAVLMKALKATGWDKRKSENFTWKEKGTFSGTGANIPYEGEFYWSLPDKLRYTMTGNSSGHDFRMVGVVNGEKGWEKAGTTTNEMSKEKLEHARNETYVMGVMSLKPLLDEKAGFDLKALPEATVDGKKCPGFSVAKKDKPTVNLWFDRETGLPAKIEYKVKNEFDNWKEATDEMFPGDWKDEDSGKVFRKMKVLRNGKVTLEAVMSDFKMPDKVDPAVYEKP